MPNLMTKRPRLSPNTSSQTNPGDAPSITIALKSLRNPPIDLRLSGQALSTSIHELKIAVAEKLGEKGTEKIRLLYKKKPCSDSKTIAEVVGEESAGEVEFGVMVIGWTAPQLPEATEAATIGAEGQQGSGADVEMKEAPVAQGPSGEEVMNEDEFWDDLKGWLLQRVRDEGVAAEAVGCFMQGWYTGRGPR